MPGAQRCEHGGDARHCGGKTALCTTAVGNLSTKKTAQDGRWPGQWLALGSGQTEQGEAHPLEQRCRRHGRRLPRRATPAARRFVVGAESVILQRPLAAFPRTKRTGRDEWRWGRDAGGMGKRWTCFTHARTYARTTCRTSRGNNALTRVTTTVRISMRFGAEP